MGSPPSTQVTRRKNAVRELELSYRGLRINKAATAKSVKLFLLYFPPIVFVICAYRTWPHGRHHLYFGPLFCFRCVFLACFFTLLGLLPAVTSCPVTSLPPDMGFTFFKCYSLFGLGLLLARLVLGPCGCRRSSYFSPGLPSRRVRFWGFLALALLGLLHPGKHYAPTAVFVSWCPVTDCTGRNRGRASRLASLFCSAMALDGSSVIRYIAYDFLGMAFPPFLCLHWPFFQLSHFPTRV